MILVNEIWALFKKDVLLELRQGYTLGGVLLYVLSTVFIVYIASIRIPIAFWNILFWIIVLFASVNAIAKSFVQEGQSRRMYYYTLASPTAVILSKVLYNVLLLSVLSLLSYWTFSVVASNPVKNQGQFLLILLLGSTGFSIAFTFIAAIASGTKNNATLMAILSFPIIIPILLTLIKLSANALGLITDTSVGSDMMILIAIDLMLLGLTLVLFPNVWKD